MKRIKFHTEDPQILDANVQNLVAWMIWPPRFVYPCFKQRCDYLESRYVKG